MKKVKPKVSSPCQSVSVRVNPYTLIEMLFVILLTGVILNAATSFYFKGRTVTRKYVDKAVQTRTASIAADYWRDFVHKNGRAAIVKPDKIVFSNKSTIAVKKNILTFSEHGSGKSLALAKSYSATFDREQPPGEAPLLVLYLRPIGSKGQVLKDKAIRIAASTGGKS